MYTVCVYLRISAHLAFFFWKNVILFIYFYILFYIHILTETQHKVLVYLKPIFSKTL